MPDLLVFINGEHAGDIHVDGSSAVFEYSEAYRLQPAGTPLSLSIPMRVGGPQPVGAWLDGLLPDSAEVREAWRSQHNVTNTHTAALLASPIGLDCAGAVQFCEPAKRSSMTRDGELVEIGPAEIAVWIREARENWPVRHNIGPELQFSLGGAQAKYALHFADGNWSVPFGSIPTTHIIKPGMIGFPDADVVEHVCLRTAHLVGLDAVHTELVRFDGERALVVERYDRVRHGERIERVHNEDMCQALAVSPIDKYQRRGGPSPIDIVELLSQNSSDPAADLVQFRDTLIYNWAIVAPDAHAKNYSLFLDRGNVKMTPPYDIISGLPYAPEDRWGDLTLAMTVVEGFEVRRMDNAEVWKSVAHVLALDPQETVTRAAEIVDAVPEACKQAINELDELDRSLPVVKTLERGLRQRSEQLRSTFVPPTRPRKESNKSAKSRQAPVNSVARVVICGQPLSKGRGQCKRRLSNTVCPFHPTSPGSLSVRQRSGDFASPDKWEHS